MTPPQLRTDLCALCHRAMGMPEAPRVITVLLAQGRRERFRIEDITAVEAQDKGVQYYLRSGRKVFELHTVKAIEKQFPDLLRINRGILVGKESVTAVVRHPTFDDTYAVELEGWPGLILPISRREWRSVATAFGWTLRNGQRAAYRNLPPRQA